MGALEQYYDLSPVGVIDRNKWDLKIAEVAWQFRQQAVYTPLMDWDTTPQQTGAASIEKFELLEGDVDSNPIPMTAMYVDAQGLDSRSRKFSQLRYGDKVQYHKADRYFNMWKSSGGRDWKGLLQGLLGYNIVRKHELLARNVWFTGPKSYWSFAGGKTSWGTLLSTDKFDIGITNEWNLRLGNTGSPVVPNDFGGSKVAIMPPGITYDFMKSLSTAANNETALWRDARIYNTIALNYELGSYKNIRFVEAPSDKFGLNPNVLYNAGAIDKQYAVTEPIRRGDGAPSPDTTAVDSVWFVGQKNVTHSIKLEDYAQNDFKVNDFVSIHIKRDSTNGVTNGVDVFDGRTIVRRVVDADYTNNTLTFDRPILWDYTAGFAGKSVTGNTDGVFYAYVTKAQNIGFMLVMGSRGGVQGTVLESMQFHEPKPIDDFDSVWRFSWDEIIGYNVADPNYFELHFCAVSIPKPGGVG